MSLRMWSEGACARALDGRRRVRALGHRSGMEVEARRRMGT